MSYPKLKTDYKEFEIVGGEEKKYNLTSQGNNRYAFTDKTEYVKDSRGNVIGDYIVAANINTTHMYINALASEWSSWITVSIATPLPPNLKDAQHSGNKIYEMVALSDNEVELIDRTTYTQAGSTYNAATINKANRLLNNMSEQYDINANQIRSMLASKGATSTNDILAAFDQMIARQRSLGQSAGVAYVKNHPENVGLKSYETYVDKVNENKDINQTVATIIPELYSASNDIITNYDSFIPGLYDSALNSANSIVAGIYRSTAEGFLSDSLNSSVQMYAKELEFCVEPYEYKRSDWSSALHKLVD